MKKYRVVLLSTLAIVLMVGVAWAVWNTFHEDFLQHPGNWHENDFPLTANVHYRALIDVEHTDFNGKALCQVWGSGGLLYEFTIKESNTPADGYHDFTVSSSDTYYLYCENVSQDDLAVMVYWQYEN